MAVVAVVVQQRSCVRAVGGAMLNLSPNHLFAKIALKPTAIFAARANTNNQIEHKKTMLTMLVHRNPTVLIKERNLVFFFK